MPADLTRINGSLRCQPPKDYYEADPVDERLKADAATIADLLAALSLARLYVALGKQPWADYVQKEDLGNIDAAIAKATKEIVHMTKEQAEHGLEWHR